MLLRQVRGAAQLSMLKGSFSYKQNKKFKYLINPEVGVYVARISDEVARIYFKNPSTGKLLRCSQVGQNVHIVNNDTHEIQHPHLDQLVIVWTGSYSLYVNELVVMTIYNQRQQTIQASQHPKNWEWNPKDIDDKVSEAFSDNQSISSLINSTEATGTMGPLRKLQTHALYSEQDVNAALLRSEKYSLDSTRIQEDSNELNKIYHSVMGIVFFSAGGPMMQTSSKEHLDAICNIFSSCDRESLHDKIRECCALSVKTTLALPYSQNEIHPFHQRIGKNLNTQNSLTYEQIREKYSLDKPSNSI